MPNETETPSMQSDLPGAPAHAQAGGKGNGFDSVASQYRAMQEAQLLHEETINQLREEVRTQRERLAELARANPAQRTGQLDMVLLRLSELERKIGEGAPDPLLNEIVHRLAALENTGPTRGLKDPRVDDVFSQLDTLRQSVAAAGATDSRTDDLVLRIASLEGAFRRAAQSRDPEEVQARIDALTTDLQQRHSQELSALRAELSGLSRSAQEAAAGLADRVSSEALDEVSLRLASLEVKLESAASEQRVSDMARQLAELNDKLANADRQGLGARLEALEERVAQQAVHGALESIAERVDSIEERLDRQPVGQHEELARRLDALREHLDAVSAVADDPETSQRLAELAGSVTVIDARLTALQSNPAWEQEVRERLGRLEQAASARLSSASELARLETEIHALRAESTRAPALPVDLVERLTELEKRVTDAESSSRLEDADARLHVIESKLHVLGEPGEISRRLTVLEMDDASGRDPRLDDALQRLAALETKPFETLSDDGIRELQERVAQLHDEIEKVSAERLPAVTELPDRLARLEAKVAEGLQAQPDPGGDEALCALRDEIQALAGRVETLSARPTGVSLQDPRFSELAARLEWIERNAGAQADNASTGDDVESIKRRLDAFEERLNAAPAEQPNGISLGMQAELTARLYALEQSLENLEHRDSGDVDHLATALKSETDRWNQWARSTMQEIAELRNHVGDGPSSAPAIDAESVQALAVQISTNLNGSEVKALRGQMYFVYLALGVIWALLMYSLFTS